MDDIQLRLLKEEADLHPPQVCFCFSLHNQ